MANTQYIPPVPQPGGPSSPDRICTACDKTTPDVTFKKRGSAGTTYHSMCNRCLYLRYTRPGAARKTQAVHAFKLAAGCVDCGYNAHPAALEFDHLPGTNKLFNIGEKVACYTPAVVWAEIAKCEVVCANCHAIRTVRRREVQYGELAIYPAGSAAG